MSTVINGHNYLSLLCLFFWLIQTFKNVPMYLRLLFPSELVNIVFLYHFLTALSSGFFFEKYLDPNKQNNSFTEFLKVWF